MMTVLVSAGLMPRHLALLRPLSPQVLDGHITAKQAVFEIMNLPQIEER